MNLKSTYQLAVVLTKSQLRGYQRTRLRVSVFGDPRIILLVDCVIVLVLASIGYAISAALPAALQMSVREVESEALVGIPAAVAFAVILFGVGTEISQPIQSANTDLVNWLPISPCEYVGGSTMSLSYSYSFMPSLFLGLTLGPALLFGMVPIWSAAVVMSVLSLFVGASVVEILRALTNRISSSFYKKSGRSGIFVRLFLTIVILVFIQLVFSGRIIVYLLQSEVEAVRSAWFIPVVWPSLTMLSLIEGNVRNSSSFASLSMILALALFFSAVVFRARFWVPVPVSIKLGGAQTHRPIVGRIVFPWFGSAESAILLKDLRSLVRRREMARFLAIPLLLIVSIGVSLIPLGGSSFPEAPGYFATIPLYLFPVATVCGSISMTSLGQEGAAIWNLYVAPIEARQLLKPKLLLTVLFGIAFSLGLLAAMGFFLKAVSRHYPVLLLLGLATVLEESALGLYVGARFPDFRETVRSRYVTVWGSLLGMLLGLSVITATVSPVLASILILPSATGQAAVLAFVVASIVSVCAWKMAERQARMLLQNVRG